MTTYRCQNEHPDFPGQRCNAKIEVTFQGRVELRCWRCKNPVVLEEPKLVSSQSESPSLDIPLLSRLR